jgi:glutamate dehydrogenase
VWLPRDAQSTAMRMQVQDLLEAAAGAQVLDWSLQVEGSTLALIRFVLDIRDGDADPDEAALDAAVQALVRGWEGAVEAELAKARSHRAAAIAARLPMPFPSAIAAPMARARRRATSACCARWAARTRRAAPRASIASRAKAGRLKLYQREGAIILSDAVPVLENFGFRVLEEVPTPLDKGRLGYIHDFLVAHPADVRPRRCWSGPRPSRRRWRACSTARPRTMRSTG